MTRFARAKGSKASNVKTPEDSTPWEVMKEQLMKSKKENEEANKREEAEKQRVENYNKFLKEQKTQKRQATWCDFPEAVQIKKPKVALNLETTTKKQKKKKKRSSLLQHDTEIDKNTTLNPDNVTNNEKKDSLVLNSEPPGNDHSQKEKIKKKNKKQLEDFTDNHNKSLVDGITDNSHTTDPSKNNSDNIEAVEISKPKDKKNKNKKKNMFKENLQIESTVDNKPIEGQNSKSKRNKKNNSKMLDGIPIRRKAINDRSFELIINAKNVELVRFDGFPIMKRDADRLQDLKNNMIKKGIPKSEVQRTMKLERRRAEKALARLKRDVCYNCRKGGHNLSDCPDLKSKIPGKETVEGICFKCGSTEHRQFECKVQRDKEFRFATCFICREPGHIARQCPDNPKGLYPNGGGCKLCGDVTHLRKDCPTVLDKKEETSIKLRTIATDDLEDIGQQAVKVPEEKPRKPKKITF